jgi:hypothetical protein
MERRGEKRQGGLFGLEDERTVRKRSVEAVRRDAMRCKAVSWSPEKGLNSTPGRPEGKDEEKEKTGRTLESYLGAQAICRKESSPGLRSNGKIGLRREEWCGRVSVVRRQRKEAGSYGGRGPSRQADGQETKGEGERERKARGQSKAGTGRLEQTALMNGNGLGWGWHWMGPRMG